MPHTVDIQDSLAYRIHRFARLLRKQFLSLATANGFDLTPEQWFVLNRLRREDGASQTDLTESIFSDRPNLTRMVVKMADKGLVRRREDPEDGRRVRVFLTKKGQRLHDGFAELVEAERHRLFAGISQKEIDTVDRVFERLEQNMSWEEDRR